MAASDFDLAHSPSTESYHHVLEHPHLFSRLVDDDDQLVLITALVVTAVVALFLQHVLGSLRRASSHKLLHVVVLGAYTLSYTLVTYTLGLMQASRYYFVEFPVWAVCLLMLLCGTDNVMACNLNDVEDWKRFHVKHLLKGGLVIYIVVVYGTFSKGAVPEYQKPLWGILLVIVLQSCVWIKSMRMASKSNLLFRNVKPIVDHMKHEHEDKVPDDELPKVPNPKPWKATDMSSVVTFLEVFQLYLHMASDWFKVALIRSYVTRNKPYASGRSDCFSDTIISCLLRLKRLGTWEDKLGQYSLLQNCNAARRISYCIHYMTLCLVEKAKKGRKRGKLVKLSTEVKKAVIDSHKGSNGHLTNGARSLLINKVHDRLSWACEASDGMVTHTILVWHVAATICKHNLDAALVKDGKKIAEPSVKDNSAAASTMSQYCAYLVAFAPDLLPDHSFVSASMLDKSIEDARILLGGAKTMKEKCRILASNNDTSSEEVVKMGARLASQLMGIENRWKVLSDFWAEMMLYIAPCDDAQARAHLEALARGGEFITHLWALLTHGGVLKRAPTRSEAV